MATPRPSNRYRPSLHGLHSGMLPQGLNRDKERIHADGGFAAGVQGANRHFGGPFSVELWDDFIGDLIADEWGVVAGSDSPAGGVISTNIGGTAVLTTGDSNVSLAADGIQLHSYLNWKAANGDLVFETRLKISAITTVQAFWGLTDQISALEMPASLSGTTYTTTATDAVGFLFDTGATTKTIRLVGVANDTDATHLDTSDAWAADTYAIWRIQVDSSGNATFFKDGVILGKVSSALTASVALTPVWCARSLTTSSRTLTIDYAHVSMAR